MRLAGELVLNSKEEHTKEPAFSSWRLTSLSYQVPPRELELPQKCSCIAALPCEVRAVVCQGWQLWLLRSVLCLGGEGACWSALEDTSTSRMPDSSWCER